MSELEEKLTVADRVCQKMCGLFEEAANQKKTVQNDYTRTRRKNTLYSVGIALGGIIVGDMITSLLVRLFIFLPNFVLQVISTILNLVVFAGSIIAAVFVNKEIFFPKTEEKHKAEMQEVEKKEAAARQYMEDNIEALSILPDDYWYPLATGYILKVVKTGRAETINKALEMLDVQLHRWKVEEANEAILAQQKSQTDALKGIRRSSAVSAAANVVSAAADIARL